VDDIRLSPYGNASSEPSPVNRMMAEFAEDFRPGVDINLGVGYVNEDTIPREQILEAMRAVVSGGDAYGSALNYGGPDGSHRLTDAIRSFLVQNGVGGPSADVVDGCRIIIGPNGATSLLESIACVLRPGIVFTSDPLYYIYCNFLERRGYELVAVPEDAHGIRTDLLREAIDGLGARGADISFIYVVTVSNPTGTILADSRRDELVDIAAETSARLGRKVPVFLDRAYEDLIHDPAVPAPASALGHDPHGVVYEIGTLSKVLAPALRIGYMVGANAPFVEAMVQRTSDAGFSAPLLNQEAAGYLLRNALRSQVERVNLGYRVKAERVGRCIQRSLGRALEACSGGSAGFYYYLTLRSVQTGEGSPFFRYLARTTGDPTVDGPPDSRHPRVAFVPGEHCVHPRGQLVALGKRQLRLSYGYEPVERIEEAVGLIARAVAYAQQHPRNARAAER